MTRKNQKERMKKVISETEEFRLFQYLVYKFEIIALKVTDIIADKLNQMLIALIFSVFIQFLAVFNINEIDTNELLMRNIILIVTIVCIKIVKKSIDLKIDHINSFVTRMINIVMIVTILNLISELKIYHFLIFKLLLAIASIFWIASMINSGSDMYLDDEKWYN